MYCNSNPVMGYDPNGNWDWSKFWKITGTVIGLVVGSFVGSTIPTVTCTPNEYFSNVNAAAAIGATVGANIATIVESNNYVNNCDVEMMDDESFNDIVKSGTDIGLSREQKLSYIRRIRATNETLAENWTEGQMLREMEYHERGYRLFKVFGESFSLVDRFKKTDFEEQQTFKSYFYRFIGNTFFW